MALYWLAVEALTGKIIADLPLLDGQGGPARVKSVIGRFDTTALSLPIAEAPENWLRATKPEATNLILLSDNPNDPAHGIPVWGGMITTRRRTAGDNVDLSVATIESYLDRRFVGDVTFTGIGQNAIISSLITSYVTAGANGGIPLRVVGGTGGTARDRTYADKNNQTVYSALQDLMGLLSGPEWTIGWEWQTSPERITPVLYIASRIGTAAVNGQVNATFEIPGPITAVDYMEDYSNGRGANSVIAYSSGTTAARPQSTPAVIADPERPTFEHRFSPSTSISDVATLNSYAQIAVQAMDTGTNVIGLSYEANPTAVDAPQLNIDWFIGDDVGYIIGGTNADGTESVPTFPGGLKGIARTIGWEGEISELPIITPIIASASL